MTSTSRRAVTNPIHVFSLIWLGQLVSSLGTGLTQFSVGVFVYQNSDSVTEYSLASFFGFLPMMLLAPLAGSLVDRRNRQRVMLLADLGAIATVMLMWGLVTADRSGLWSLRSWHFYLPLAMGSACSTFRTLAFSASTALLIPKQHLGRANGLIELAIGAGQLLSPVLAGVLVVKIGLEGVLLINISTYLCALGALLCVLIPQPPLDEDARRGRPPLRTDIVLGWRFIRERPGLLGLLAFSSAVNLFTVLVTVLITPLVLSFASPSTLGWVVTCAGSGMLFGGVTMGVWGGPKRRVLGLLGANLVAGMALWAAAMPASVFLFAGAAFVFMFTSPVATGSSQAIWQTKVPPAIQGRVFATRRMLALAAPPLAALLAGPLADRVFDPWMARDGLLADSVGRLLGTGPGRGIALLYVILGLLLVVSVLAACLSPRIRAVEDELPDALLPPPTPLQGQHG
ncbi:MFS transporter [Corallococcus sp. CA054B]|uniref:MFS transporter n=1 Tax=Corallococcus sp. CA054B TaxID=2316734 RepID=UPI000EA1B055|nr:MFS transporter [Corallococcus sp. CA054B]RKG71253.1 MFS transporter [Corallococcus sp. CA054B]